MPGSNGKGEPVPTSEAVAMGAEEEKPKEKKPRMTLCQFLDKRYFLIGMVLVIVIAAIHPDEGAKKGKLKPKITASWVAVCIIFFLAGWSLKTYELVKAALYCKLNSFVQLFNLVFIPFTVYGLVNLLMLSDLDDKLLKGLLISSCLATTVSMCVVLTTLSGGNDAAAIFNAAFGNLLGIFVTPLLILLLAGSESDVPLEEVLIKLILKIFVPLCVGQCVQYAIPGARKYYKDNKKHFKRCQETLLLWIVYTSFCNTFKQGTDAKAGDFIATLVIVIFLYLFFVAAALFLSGLKCWNFSRRDRVALLFCATHKTVAAGVPLLNTIFEGHPDLGMFLLPLLIWHPLQLLVGNLLLDRLSAWVDGCDRSLRERAIAEGDDVPPEKAAAAPETAVAAASGDAATV